MMNLRQMSYFCRVVDAGNITGAAEALRLAQPAIGAQMRLLEDELGVQLLVRHSRGVRPTPAGRLLYSRATRILAEVERVEREVRATRLDAPSQIRLGVGPSMVMALGPETVLEETRGGDGPDFSLMEERTAVLADALRKDQIDIGLLYNVPETPEFTRRALAEEDLLLVTAPDRAPDKDTVPFSEALTHELAIGSDRGAMRRIVEAEAARLSFTLHVAYEVHSVSSMKALVAKGSAATITPYALVANEVDSGELAVRAITRPVLTRTLYLVERKGAELIGRPDIAPRIDALVTRLLDRLGPWARRI